jgi:hypothetical protein
MIIIFNSIEMFNWKLRDHLREHFENYFGRIRYIVYKAMLYKGKEYYDTYDLGKLSSYADSGNNIKDLFGHNFLEAVHHGVWCL